MTPPPAEQTPLNRALHALALAITYTFSPLLLPIIGVYAGARALGAGLPEALGGAAVMFVLVGLVPLAFLSALVRRGDVVSLELRERQKRTVPYLVGATTTALSAAGLFALLAPERHLLAAATAAQAFNLLVLMAINLRWKISLHLAAVATTFALLAWTAHAGGAVPPILLAALAALVPLVAWARLRLDAHTTGQIVMGTLFGLAALPLELWALG